jgi:hypothetical protein
MTGNLILEVTRWGLLMSGISMESLATFSFSFLEDSSVGSSLHFSVHESNDEHVLSYQ